jgi:hypothetical protein
MYPTHFDTIDDRTAHCVSGNTLTPGDYPVGMFFTHPLATDVQFFLHYLPTPRHRLAHACHAGLNQARRLAELSQRTTARYVAEKKLLGRADIETLSHLDPSVLSQFGGEYFMAVDDQYVTSRPRLEASANHAALCLVLFDEGTHEAIEGLMQAIRAERFLQAPGELNYPWVAALVISQRDPWPDLDQWLAGLVPSEEPLVQSDAQGPQLGATAAAILLARHGRMSFEFEIQAVEGFPTELGLIGYRYATADAPQRVLAWWDDERALDVQP